MPGPGSSPRAVLILEGKESVYLGGEREGHCYRPKRALGMKHLNSDPVSEVPACGLWLRGNTRECTHATSPPAVGRTAQTFYA